ncbi:MAG TPA: class I tRNA ligase family protein, partial [Candidatus Saccharimonadales bacterium]|nr:class I tRNA ligase family protein [Candidatus Saccharimonadales bacterium]
EAMDQTRGWFYTLHVLATALHDKPAFKNVIVSGWINAADGEKLSKRKKNYAPMDDIFDQYGVDSMRFFMASSPLVNGEDTRFSTDFLRDVQRKIFMTLNNIFNFYKLYADVDGYKPAEPLQEPRSDNILDQWMLSRLNETIAAVTTAMDGYRLDKAARPINDLLDDASNWYVRRSRRRFWKSEDDTDKQQAYVTLHYTLLRLCQLLAPFSPFLPDHLWQQLAAGTDLPPSVHLSDWPEPGQANKDLLYEMSKARDYIVDGLAQRAEAKIKVRQPLQSVSVPELADVYRDIISEELNVKEVAWNNTAAEHQERLQKPAGEGVIDAIQNPPVVKLNTEITLELKAEGLMREVVRHVQKARKDAGLEVDNRINLQLNTEDKELQAVLQDQRLADIIKHETLAVSMADEVANGYEVSVKVDGAELSIHLTKA